jgi:parvulin-like peptidyl-prolyl isomerase
MRKQIVAIVLTLLASGFYGRAQSGGLRSAVDAAKSAGKSEVELRAPIVDDTDFGSAHEVLAVGVPVIGKVVASTSRPSILCRSAKTRRIRRAFRR